MDDPILSRGTIGVEVRSLDRHDTLFGWNQHKLLMPASTAKVVTLSAAADRLGWDFTYRTRLFVNGTVADGILNGDLIVVGAGDPTIDDWAGDAAKRFAQAAAALKERGIFAVTGRLIGDDNIFADGDVSPGWAWDDLYASYGAAVSGLQFNQNTARIAATPTTIGGAPAVDIVPDTAPIVLHNRARVVREPGDHLVLGGEPRTSIVVLDGTVSPGPRRFVRNVSVPNPTLYFVRAMNADLARHGIDVRGGVADLDDVAEPYDRSGAVEIMELFSTTLAGVAEPMMKNSQNMYAETLFRTLGLASGTPATVGSSQKIVSEALSSWGIAPQEFNLVDGSGLSRYNLITPDAMSRVLARVWDDERLREQFLRTLPVAGVDGTLSRRMTGTAAEDNARAKTGSFSNARGAAGFVQSADGEPLAFVIFANNYNDLPARIDQVTDRIIVALAEFTRGSR